MIFGHDVVKELKTTLQQVNYNGFNWLNATTNPNHQLTIS